MLKGILSFDMKTKQLSEKPPNETATILVGISSNCFKAGLISGSRKWSHKLDVKKSGQVIETQISNLF